MAEHEERRIFGIPVRLRPGDEARRFLGFPVGERDPAAAFADALLRCWHALTRRRRPRP